MAAQASGAGWTAETEDGKLVIAIDLKNVKGLSKSGKSQIIATTSGNIKIGDVTVGLNVYKPV